MRIAVVGSGIAGLGAAWLLSRRHEVVLYERESRLGGHTHTHRVELAGKRYEIDSGFIVFNPENYPLLNRMFEELGVTSQPTTMSFSVQDVGRDLEYNAGNLGGLFCQRGNLVSPRFWRMLADIVRFHRRASDLLDLVGDGPTLDEYLSAGDYSELFAEAHLIPMAAALWSAPAGRIRAFPAKYLIRFMANHGMLKLTGRPVWRVVSGGSARYIDALTRTWSVRPRLAEPVRRIRRIEDDGWRGVEIVSDSGVERFDRAVLACHGDLALSLLETPSETERAVLGATRYQDNDTVLHTDARLLPRRRKAWAAWNAHVPATPDSVCTVSYWMNRLQGLDSPEPFVVTLGRGEAVDPNKVLARMRYRHPLYEHESVRARARRAEIDGVDRIHYAGAYWGHGFHEDGLRSGVEVARALGVSW